MAAGRWGASVPGLPGAAGRRSLPRWLDELRHGDLAALSTEFAIETLHGTDR